MRPTIKATTNAKQIQNILLHISLLSSMAQQQKAIARSTTLPPSLNVVARPIPTPGNGEVLVRIKAAGLNPVDWKAWKYPNLVVFMTCAGLGADVAGVVEAVGADAGSWKVGDHMWVSCFVFFLDTDPNDMYATASPREFSTTIMWDYRSMRSPKLIFQPRFNIFPSYIPTCAD